VKGAGKGKNGMNETDGNSEEDVSTLNHSNEKQFEQSSQLLDVLPEHLVRYCCGPSFSQPKK
jgi:La-related protein 7